MVGKTEAKKEIDKYIQFLPDWSRKICEKLRAIIHKADPNLTEALKWGCPAFTYNGKLTVHFWAFSKNARLFFFEGALMTSSADLSPRFPLKEDDISAFNSSVESDDGFLECCYERSK